MSASFCFIEDCEFIGPFGNCGLFIKKYENDEKYCYSKDVELKTTDLNCSIDLTGRQTKLEDKMELENEKKRGEKRKRDESPKESVNESNMGEIFDKKIKI